MENSINYSNPKSRYCIVLTLGLLLIFWGKFTQAQNYLEGTKTGNYYNVDLLGSGGASVSAPMTTYSSGGFRYFYGPTSVLTGSTTQPTTLTANHLNAVVGLTGADVYVQFRNTGNAIISAGTTTYLKLGDQPVNSGLNLNAGALLGLTDIYNIKGSVYKSAGDYVFDGPGLGYSGNENTGVPISGDAQTVTKLVIDKNNQWHAAVTPPATEDYNSVRLNVALPAGFNIVSAATTTATVYNAFTLPAGDGCSVRPIFTSFGNTGVNLNTGALLGGLDLSQFVSDAYKAIDDDPASYSSFKSGIASVGVASTVAQEFIFDHTASAGDAVKIQMALNASIIALGVFSGGVTFKAYKGTSTVPVATQELQGAPPINGGYADLTATFAPNVEFDRIEVSLNTGLLSAGIISDALRIFDVEISAPEPVISASVTPSDTIRVQANQPLPTITATSDGNDILWYEGNSTTPMTGSPSPSPSNLPVASIATPGTYVYYAASQRPGCTNTSAKVPVVIIVEPPLPVTLTSFNARKTDAGAEGGIKALLSWSTTSETNSDRFEIERSQNGRNWDLIGTRKSNTQSVSERKYDFVDAEPVDGENLYRLRMVDIDGTFAYSRIESLDFSMDLTFYPNPATEKLLIRVSDFSTVKQVQIYNASGRIVYQSSGKPDREINIGGLPTGLYVMQLVRKNGSVISRKIIK